MIVLLLNLLKIKLSVNLTGCKIKMIKHQKKNYHNKKTKVVLRSI